MQNHSLIYMKLKNLLISLMAAGGEIYENTNSFQNTSVLQIIQQKIVENMRYSSDNQASITAHT